MKKIAVSLLTVVAVFFLFVASGFGWGNDVQIYSSQINTFDVDYDLGTGNMFVAFQATGEDVIRLYSSTDHGISWAEIANFGTNPYQGTTSRSDLRRIRVIYNNGKVHIFWVDSAGSLNRWGCTSTGGAKGGSRVSAAPILEGSFTVTLDLGSGRLYAGWKTGTGSQLARQIFRYSDDNGITWTDRFNWTASDQALTQSLAYGPDDHIHLAFGTQQYGSPAEIKYIRFPSSGGLWDENKRLTNNSIPDYDPRVAAAYVNDSGVWMLYNRDRGGHEIDLMNAYSPDGGVTWNAPTAVAAEDGIDEYISDVKFYKAPENSYVNMVYIKDDPNATPVRKAIWMYASTGDPSWREAEVFNDEDVQSWPEDTAPRIVYSPGADAPGGGVVFSYFGAQGLYFDAPWIISMGSFLPVYPFPVYPLLPTHALTVTIHGSGSVVSSPAGLNCTHNSAGDKVCTHNFIEGTAVALTATPIDGSGYTSHFIDWSGDCSGSGACPLVMDSDKSVEANFGALGIPVFALPVPAGQEAWNYPPVENPLLLPDPANCKPFAVGDLMTGNLSLQVGLPPFSAGVDIYLAVECFGSFYLINGSNEFKLFTPAMTELPQWKTNASFVDINEPLYGDIPLALLPSGLYNLYIAVVPTGETDFSHYYFWSTYFLAL